MPELPQVEMFKRTFDKNALHQKVTQIELSTTRILDHITEAQLREALIGRQFTHSRRYGKLLFAHTDGKGILAIHFGMHGKLDYGTQQTKRYPSNMHIILNDDEAFLSYSTRFGKITLCENEEDFIKKRELGPEILGMKQAQFVKALTGSKLLIKPLLMDQHLMAGIGNVVADEMLFQARLNPKSRADKLTSEDLKKLYKLSQKILKKSIDVDGVWENLPDNFMTRHRRRDNICPISGEKFTETKAGARTTYYCETCQGKPIT